MADGAGSVENVNTPLHLYILLFTHSLVTFGILFLVSGLVPHLSFVLFSFI